MKTKRTQLEIANRIIEIEDGAILARYRERADLGAAKAKKAVQVRCLKSAQQILDASSVKEVRALLVKLHWDRNEISEFVAWLERSN